MHLAKLRIFQYRNLRDLEILPSPGINLFSGRNGQGKTNLLEAIYFLAFGKSFRTAIPAECINHEKTECRIEGTVVHGGLSRNLQVLIGKAGKKLFLLDKPVGLEEFIGNLNLMAFTHDHLNIVRGGPAERRAFIDRAMITLYPGYMRNLAEYGRALRQRNKMLSALGGSANGVDEALLDSWDEALIGPGAKIAWQRWRYVERMKQQLPVGLWNDEKLKMHYFSTIPLEGQDLLQIEENFRRQLRKTRSADLKLRLTSIGPHRDDLKIYLNGKSLSHFASAGQQRWGLLSLYFSQMEIHRQVHGFYPVFLMDDVEAELDKTRLRVFLAYLKERSQTFITSAKGFLFGELGEAGCHFEVESGMVTRLP